MKKITNREEANFYYKKVNDVVKKYTSSKVRPSEVKMFIQNNLDRILTREGLSDVFGIKRVVDDVLDHHDSMESDGVLTFENFTFLEKGGDLFSHEKFLGDLFDCDLDSIKLIDNSINKFSVSSFGDTFNVFIFSEEEFEFIRQNLIDKLVLSFGGRELETKSIEEVDFDPSIIVKVSDFWDESVVRSKFENEFSEVRFKKFLPYMLMSQDSTDAKITIIGSPSDLGYYVYSEGEYDLIFKLKDKIM